MNIIIVAGGPLEAQLSYHSFAKSHSIWVGVDRGVYYLLKEGIVPSQAFGDFDSVNEDERTFLDEHIRHLNCFPKEKDETDLEIAINWALDQRPHSITVIGATGGRLDHELANIQMLTKALSRGIEMKIVDKHNQITLRNPGSYTVERLTTYRYLSFLAFSKNVLNLTIDGVKYPLTNATLAWGQTLCISNEITCELASYSFTSGILLEVRSKD